MAENVPQLGKLAPDDAFRDAIRIAVAPVMAAEELHPGWRVDLNRLNQAVNAPGAGIGIVDPFLTRIVRKGEVFWLLLPPGAITSLRYVWTHPAFKAKVPGRE